MTAYGLEREVMDLETSQRGKGDICKRLLEINRQIIPCTSERAGRISEKLGDLFVKLRK